MKTNVSLKQRLVGLGVSAGKVTGRVVVLTNIARGWKQSSIIVASRITMDWSPYLKKASAIVCETGGLTSHASVIAREYGIPCVVGIKSATKILRTGMVVKVDGLLGTVDFGDSRNK